MLAMLATAAMTAAVAAGPTPTATPRVFVAAPTNGQVCKSNGRYEVADRALLYRQDGKAKVALLGALPKANHEKAVLRTVDGCTAPVVVAYEVGR